MTEQEKSDHDQLNADFVVDLVNAYWNLAAVLAEQAMQAGIPAEQIAAAVKSLAQRNQKSLTRTAGAAVNDGIWRLFDIYDPSKD